MTRETVGHKATSAHIHEEQTLRGCARRAVKNQQERVRAEADRESQLNGSLRNQSDFIHTPLMAVMQPTVQRADQRLLSSPLPLAHAAIETGNGTQPKTALLHWAEDGGRRDRDTSGKHHIWHLALSQNQSTAERTDDAAGSAQMRKREDAPSHRLRAQETEPGVVQRMDIDKRKVFVSLAGLLGKGSATIIVESNDTVMTLKTKAMNQFKSLSQIKLDALTLKRNQSGATEMTDDDVQALGKDDTVYLTMNRQGANLQAPKTTAKEDEIMPYALSSSETVTMSYVNTPSEERLNAQQNYNAVKRAIKANQSLRIVLIDPNFANQSLDKQIAGQLAEDGFDVQQAGSEDITGGRIHTFQCGSVTITYLGVWLSDETLNNIEQLKNVRRYNASSKLT